MEYEDAIALPWLDGYMLFNRPKLVKAYTVFIGFTDSEGRVEKVMNHLMDGKGWDIKDAILYSRAAEYCYLNNIKL